MYKIHVKFGFENLIIIDADDLLDRPKYYLKKYCDIVGLKYTDDMVDRWKKDNNCVKIKTFLIMA